MYLFIWVQFGIPKWTINLILDPYAPCRQTKQGGRQIIKANYPQTWDWHYIPTTFPIILLDFIYLSSERGFNKIRKSWKIFARRFFIFLFFEPFPNVYTVSFIIPCRYLVYSSSNNGRELWKGCIESVTKYIIPCSLLSGCLCRTPRGSHSACPGYRLGSGAYKYQ